MPSARDRRPRGGEELSIQAASMSTTTLNYSDAHPKRRSQFSSSIASAPSRCAATESFDATHVTSSSVKSRGTVSGTSLYFSKSAHVGFYTGGTRMSGCFSWRTSATGCPVLVHWSSGRRHPTPSLLVAHQTAWRSLPDNTVSGYPQATASPPYYPSLAALSSLAAPSALSSLTRPP